MKYKRHNSRQLKNKVRKDQLRKVIEQVRSFFSVVTKPQMHTHNTNREFRLRDVIAAYSLSCLIFPLLWSFFFLLLRYSGCFWPLLLLLLVVVLMCVGVLYVKKNNLVVEPSCTIYVCKSMFDFCMVIEKYT